MSLETIYYIGQTIAVAAILVSLWAIYWQQRKDHALARATTQREILDSVKELSGFPANDPMAFESIRVCLVDFSSALPIQQVQFNHAAVMAVNMAEKALYMKREDLFDTAGSEAFFSLALSYIVTPGGQQWWQSTKFAFAAEIREHLEKKLKEGEGIASLWDAFPSYRIIEEEPEQEQTR